MRSWVKKCLDLKKHSSQHGLCPFVSGDFAAGFLYVNVSDEAPTDRLEFTAKLRLSSDSVLRPSGTWKSQQNNGSYISTQHLSCFVSSVTPVEVSSALRLIGLR